MVHMYGIAWHSCGWIAVHVGMYQQDCIRRTLTTEVQSMHGSSRMHGMVARLHGNLHDSL